MFSVTNAARIELQNRLNSSDKNSLIRLQMRKSCFMKVKLLLEDSIRPNDTEVMLDGLHFIIDQGECHYFNHKTLDFLPDITGFKQFEILN
ncbi:iron-sulfur cluster biosynthesis [Bacillus salipaludis]|uniref:iron-sulfur cluster biosynthesis n=1 Tax=Bacillus salipaludis TaxID=2547811 RepID=UPI002E24842B|nr:iron-sulfur cluster biosynthesis family protein [Bacillus salipaludis]